MKELFCLRASFECVKGNDTKASGDFSLSLALPESEPAVPFCCSRSLAQMWKLCRHCRPVPLSAFLGLVTYTEILTPLEQVY